MRIDFKANLPLVRGPQSGDFQREWEVTGTVFAKLSGTCKADERVAYEDIEILHVTKVRDSYPRKVNGEYPRTRDWWVQSPPDTGEDEDMLLWLNEQLEEQDDWRALIVSSAAQKLQNLMPVLNSAR